MIQAVIGILTKATSVQSTVGRTADGAKFKIFPVVADQGEALPYTVGSIVGNEPTQAKDEVSKLDIVSFQLINYTQFYEQCDAIDNAQRFALDGFEASDSGIELMIWFTGHKDGWDNARQCFARISDYSAQVVRRAP